MDDTKNLNVLQSGEGLAVESIAKLLDREPINVRSRDSDPRDSGKKVELVCHLEGVWPLDSWVGIWIERDKECLTKVADSSEVQCSAGKRASSETIDIVDEVAYDHVDDFLGESSEGRNWGRDARRCSPPDSGQDSDPDIADERLNHYGHAFFNWDPLKLRMVDIPDGANAVIPICCLKGLSERG